MQCIWCGEEFEAKPPDPNDLTNQWFDYAVLPESREFPSYETVPEKVIFEKKTLELVSIDSFGYTSRFWVHEECREPAQRAFRLVQTILTEQGFTIVAEDYALFVVHLIKAHVIPMPPHRTEKWGIEQTIMGGVQMKEDEE